jgi:hypothetical protein
MTWSLPQKSLLQRNLNISDAANTIDLTLDQGIFATSGYETDCDQQAPPSPSTTSFDICFRNLPNHGLIVDFRQAYQVGIIDWVLLFTPESG